MSDCPKCHWSYRDCKCRLKEDASKPELPKFQVKCEKLGSDVVATFKVRPEVHAKIKGLAEKNHLGMADIVRQMIDFALEFS